MKRNEFHSKMKSTDGTIQVGRKFQACIPQLMTKPLSMENIKNKALTVWKPTEELTDSQIDNYVQQAKRNFNFTEDQSLGLLYWHRYDVNASLEDCKNFEATVPKIKWVIEEKEN